MSRLLLLDIKLTYTYLLFCIVLYIYSKKKKKKKKKLSTGSCSTRVFTRVATPSAAMHKASRVAIKYGTAHGVIPEG